MVRLDACADWPLHSLSAVGKMITLSLLSEKIGLVRKTGSDISTTLIQGFNFTNSRFQLHEFTISNSRIHEFNFTNSTSRIHEFNFMNSRIQFHEFHFTNSTSRIHEFNFMNSRIQLHEFHCAVEVSSFAMKQVICRHFLTKSRLGKKSYILFPIFFFFFSTSRIQLHEFTNSTS